MTTMNRPPIVAGISPTYSASDVVAWAAREAMLRDSGRRDRPMRLTDGTSASVAASGGDGRSNRGWGGAP